MFCNNCGEEIADDSTFCRKCGKPLEPSNKISEEKNKIIDDNETITSVASTEDKDGDAKKGNAKKGGILIGVCCLGIILIGLFVGFSMPNAYYSERPLMTDDAANTIVSVNLSEDYLSGGEWGHAYLNKESDDDYEIIRGLNLTNKTDLEIFNTALELSKSSVQSNDNGVPYYKINSTQKMANLMFNTYGGLKVKNINTYLAFTYNNETKLAVVVLGTDSSHVTETISHVNFY